MATGKVGEIGRAQDSVFKAMLRILTFLGEQGAVGARSDVCLEKLLWILGVQEWMDEHSRRLQEGSKNPDARDVDERRERY